MKILHINTSDSFAGASIAARRLSIGLRHLGLDSKMLVAKKGTGDASVLGPHSKVDKCIYKMSPYLDSIPMRCLTNDSSSLLSPAWFPTGITKRIGEIKPDIVNLHWICNGLMTVEAIAKINAPIVWTIHDMWPFSGTEHYSSNLERVHNGYLKNNRSKNETGLDLNRWVWQRKKKAWQNLENLVIVGPSRWIANLAKESALFSARRIEVIANGVNHERYQPVKHAIARKLLNLPSDKKLLLFGAINANSDSRKGFPLLQKALKIFVNSNMLEDVELVIFGADEPKNPPDLYLPVHYMGRLYDEISLSLVYAAADLFVAPSLEDNLPNTVLEALSCGTPVVAFDIGGMPDMIEHLQNGYLTTPYDINDFANGIKWALESDERWQKLSQRARQKVEEEFTLSIQANNYKKLYDDILTKS